MQDQQKEPETAKSEPSKVDLARIIKMFWEALLVPQWSKDDLIDLGKLLYAKVPIGKIDPSKIARLLPPLTEVAKEIHLQLSRGEDRRPETPEKTPAKPTEAA